MNEEKPNQKARIKIPMEKIEKNFPTGTSEQKIEETIIKALAMYRQRQKENRDARWNKLIPKSRGKEDETNI